MEIPGGIYEEMPPCKGFLFRPYVADDTKVTVQFRGEVFNVFNNVNMNTPNSTRSNPTFGTISAAGAPCIFQLAFRLSS
jgi:hypothetical protein